MKKNMDKEDFKKLNIMKDIFICLLIIFFIICTFTFQAKEKNKDIIIYKFNASSENFKVRDGILVILGDERYINISNFDLNKKMNIKSMTINIAFNESIWKVKDYEYDEELLPREWLNQLEFSEYKRKPNLLDGPSKEDSFMKYRYSLFPFDFKIEINYCTEELCTVEILKVNSEKMGVTNDNK